MSIYIYVYVCVYNLREPATGAADVSALYIIKNIVYNTRVVFIYQKYAKNLNK